MNEGRPWRAATRPCRRGGCRGGAAASPLRRGRASSRLRRRRAAAATPPRVYAMLRVYGSRTAAATPASAQALPRCRQLHYSRLAAAAPLRAQGWRSRCCHARRNPIATYPLTGQRQPGSNRYCRQSGVLQQVAAACPPAGGDRCRRRRRPGGAASIVARRRRRGRAATAAPTGHGRLRGLRPSRQSGWRQQVAAACLLAGGGRCRRRRRPGGAASVVARRHRRGSAATTALPEGKHTAQEGGGRVCHDRRHPRRQRPGRCAVSHRRIDVGGGAVGCSVIGQHAAARPPQLPRRPPGRGPRRPRRSGRCGASTAVLLEAREGGGSTRTR